MVERQPSKLDTWVRFPSPAYAVVAQLVERHLAKVEVASPSLVYRLYAPLAQLVEHLTLNQGAQGSSP